MVVMKMSKRWIVLISFFLLLLAIPRIESIVRMELDEWLDQNIYISFVVGAIIPKWIWGIVTGLLLAAVVLLALKGSALYSKGILIMSLILLIFPCFCTVAYFFDSSDVSAQSMAGYVLSYGWSLRDSLTTYLNGLVCFWAISLYQKWKKPGHDANGSAGK